MSQFLHWAILTSLVNVKCKGHLESQTGVAEDLMTLLCISVILHCITPVRVHCTESPLAVECIRYAVENCFLVYFYLKQVPYECEVLFMMKIKALTMGDSFQKDNCAFEPKS